MKIVKNGSTDQELKDCAVSFIHTKPQEVGIRLIKQYEDGVQKRFPPRSYAYISKYNAIEHIKGANFREVESIVFEWRPTDETR